MDISAIIDLTSMSSPVASNENDDAIVTKSPTRQTARNPLELISNSSKPATNSDDLLQSTLKSLSAAQLLAEFQEICDAYPEVRATLKKRLLVKGKDVVRYDVDSESDDDTDSNGAESKNEGNLKIIPIADDELTARYTKCLNCDEEFDVANNLRGDCLWHQSKKLSSYVLLCI